MARRNTSHKVRIPLAGLPNQRDLDSLRALIEGKDQRFRNGLIIPIHNPIAGTVKHYFEKRPGLEQGCLAAFGDRGTAIFYSRSTGKTITVFEDIDNISTPYVDCVDVGPFDLAVTPVDRGDGRFVAVTDTAIGGVAGKNVMWSGDNGQTWNTTTLTGDLANADIPWSDIDWGGDVFMAVSTSYPTNQKSKGMTSPSGETGDWTEIALPDHPNGIETAIWARPRYIPSLDTWALTCSNNDWRVPRSIDNGQNWTLTNALNGGSDAMVCSGIDYSPDHDIWVACGANINSVGLRYSDDDFATMNYATQVGGAAIPKGIIWRDIRYDPTTQLVVAGTDSGYWAYSSDGGMTYTLVTQDTNGQGLNIFRIIHTPTGMFAVSNQLGINLGRDFYRTTNGTSLTRIDLGAGSSGIYSRINYNGSVIGTAGYANDTIYKNFATAADLPDSAGDFTEYENVVPSPNVTGLSSRWSWWL